MQGDAVHDRSHTELTNAVVNVVTGSVFLAHTFAARPDGQVGTGQVGRATHQFWQQRAVGIQCVLGGLAGGDGVALVLTFLNIGLGFLGKVCRQVARHAALELGRQFRLGLFVGGELVFPGLLGRCAFLFGIPGGIDFRGHFKRAMLPAQSLASQGDFIVTQRGTVAIFLALLVGGTKADDGLAADQCRLLGVGPGLFNSRADGVGIVAVNVRNYLPAVGLKTLRSIVGKPAFHFAVDGNAVVVVEEHQLAKAQGTGQGSHFVGDAFHQAAVAQERIGVVVHNVVARAVELRRQGFLGQRETNGVGNALPQRAGRGFDTRRVTVFRVPRSLGVQLPEVLDVVNANVVPAQVQQGVLQHGAMAVRQYKTVTVGPLRVGRVVAQVIVPQYLGDIRHTHGRTRVAGLGFLNRIHAQRANGVGEIFTGRH